MEKLSNRALSTWKRYTFEQDDVLFPSQHHMILIDDDPVFQTIMSYQAELDKTSLVCLDSFHSQRDTPLLKASDVIILDYEVSGLEAPDLIREFRSLAITGPILLISQREQNEDLLTKLDNVRKFVMKSVGYGAILKLAKKIIQKRSIDFID